MIKDIIQADTEEEIQLVRFLFPEKRYVEYTPMSGDGYIIRNPYLQPNRYRAKFKDSVLIHPAGVRLISHYPDNDELDLSTLIQLLKDRGYKNTKVLKEVRKESELRDQLIYFMLLGDIRRDEHTIESVYNIMLALGNPAKVLREYFQVDLHYRIKMNLIIQFIYNALHPEEVKTSSGKRISKKYRDDLSILSRKVKKDRIKQLLMKYMKSPRKELDALDFILSI